MPKLFLTGNQIKLATNRLPFIFLFGLKFLKTLWPHVPCEICCDRIGFLFSRLHFMALVYYAAILSFLPTTQHTRWDSSAHTVTQAFRHSLARTNTISVNIHYMVLGWISGLETYQISTQGVRPPHARYCLSTTMLNCRLYAFTNANKI